MSAVRGLRRRLREQQGHTLTELLTVLSILGIVMGGLTGLLTSGIRAETDISARNGAQAQAGLALGQLRREAHCAQAASVNAGGTAVTLTQPMGCPRTTATWCTASLGTNRWGLFRSDDAACNSADRKFADYLTAAAVFAYTAPTVSALGSLRINFPVDENPADTKAAYRLVDDIVLRNTARA